MTEYFVRLIAAFIGCIGFCIFFNLKKERLLYASVLGTLSAAIYLYLEIKLPENVFVINLVPSVICTILSELSARWKKAPATIFILPSIIVLIPGGSFYYTMSYLVNGNQELFKEWGNRTVQSALGISLGILIASLVFYQVLNVIHLVRDKIVKKGK